MFEQIASIVGLIAGLLSIGGIIWIMACWKTGVDADRKLFNQCFQNYPPAEMYTMVKTLWEVYVLDALHKRPDLAEHHSAYKLKPEGENLIPDDIKQTLTQLPSNPINKEDVACGYLVIKAVGMERISLMAENKGLSVQEAIAILSTYVSERTNHA